MGDPSSQNKAEMSLHEDYKSHEETHAVVNDKSGLEEYADVQRVPISPPEILSLSPTAKFTEIFGLLYAMNEAEEFTQRAHRLTTETIKLNATNPTAWMYRRRIARALSTTRPSIWQSELAFTALLLRNSRKNYQAWEYRRHCVEQADSFQSESQFVDVVLELDPKNYHAWAHRTWLVHHGILHGQLECSAWYIQSDVRNNSAWNFRWLVTSKVGRELEVDFACKMISLAPRNESPWNYLIALSRQGLDVSRARSQASHCLVNDAGCIPARRFLILTASDEHAEEIFEHCTLLAGGIDTIRKNYWLMKRQEAVNAFGWKQGANSHKLSDT